MGFTNSLLLRRFESLNQENQTAQKTRKKRNRSQSCVVLIEPQKAEREHIATLLKDLNLRVVSAANGEEGLSLIRRHSPELVLSALDLQGIDGYMLSQRLREHSQTQDIPFMLIVNSGELPDRLIGHESYANDYIQRPISVPDFKYRVNGLLNLVKRRKSAMMNSAAEKDDPNSSPREDDVSAEQEKRNLSRQGDKNQRDLSKLKPVELIDRMKQLSAELMDCLQIVESRLESIDQVDAKEPAAGSQQESEITDKIAPEAPTSPSVSESRKKGHSQKDLLNQLLISTPERSPQPDRTGRILPFIESLGAHGESRSREVIEKYREEYRRKAREGAVFSRMKLSETFDEIFERFSDSLVLASDETTRADKQEDKPPDEQKSSVMDQIESEEVFDFPALGLSELDRLDLVTEENKSPLYNEIKQYVSQTIQLAALEKPLVLSLGEKLVGRIMDSLDEGSELLVDGLDRRQAFSVSAHSVNVCILALKLAMSSDKDRAFCVRVGLAGLLHEIGVVKLPERLLYKEAPLSQAELQLLRERPLLSSEALRSADREFGYLSGIVSQVLERRNGSGYPLALREEEIKPEACFLGISDFFEAFVHKRPYRKVLTGYQAFRELTTDESQRFGQEYVRALVESLSLYPYGEIVLLSDGRLAKVIEINPLDLSRPIVQIMKSGSVNECPTLNLSEENLRINRAVSAESIEPI